MEKVFVCAGSKLAKNEKIVNEAKRLGKILAENDCEYVQGGMSQGLMGATLFEFLKYSKNVRFLIPGAYYNYDAPYTVFEASSSEKWASFQTLNGGTSNSISITSLSGDISHENNTHYLVIDDNSLSILYGDIIGNHTVHYNIDKDTNGNSISNAYAGSVTFTSDNNGKAFVTTPTDKTNVTAPARNVKITY